MTSATPTSVMRLSLAAIVPSPDNPRKHFAPAWLAELGASMLAQGQLAPCLVRPHPKQTGKFELAAGESRYRAARIVKIAALDCVVRPMDDAQFLEALTFENLKRRDLRPLEEARSYALLQTKLEGWTVERIAEKSGVSVDYVRDRMRLLTLVPEVLALIEQERLPLSHALEIAKLSAEQQRAVIDPEEWNGVWREEREPREDLFTDSDDEDEPSWDDEEESEAAEAPATKDPYARCITVSLRELKAHITQRFPVDPEAEATAELFPTLVEAMREAAEKAVPVVHISDAWSAPAVEEGTPEILSKRDWRKADGSQGAKACKHAKTLGVGVHGGVRGQTFMVCLAKTECRAHFGDEIRSAEERAAFKRANAAPAGSAHEEPWRKQERLEREKKARFAVAQPAVLRALAASLATASTKVGGPLDTLIARERPWPKGAEGITRGTTPEDLMRFLAWREFTTNMYNAYEQLPKVGKLLGVDVAGIVKAAQPKRAAANQANQAATKGTKATKRAKAKTPKTKTPKTPKTKAAR